MPIKFQTGWEHYYEICSFKSPYQDIIKWKHFPRYWPFVQGIHRPPVNPPHKGHWRGALMFSLIFAELNTREAGDLRRYRAHCDFIVMIRFYDKTYKIWKHPQITLTMTMSVTYWLANNWDLVLRHNTSWTEQELDRTKLESESPDSKVHGANMGPIWGQQDPGEPHVGPLNLAISMIRVNFHKIIILTTDTT